MRFRDLGPLWLEADGVTRSVGGRRMQALVGVLLVRLGEAVPASTVVDAVWGPHPPQRAGASLDSLLWRLRRLLDPDRAPRSASGLLLTEDRGYRLALDGEDLDSHLLATTAATVPAALSRGDARAALTASDHALSRWRGLPYEDLSPWEGWEPVQTRLVELHLELQRHRIDALLALGAPERAVSDLVPLIEEHPFDERLWTQRMLGLAGAGRRAAALETFRHARRVLADELGLDPGHELQAAHQRILSGDPVLDSTPQATAVPSRPVRLRRRRTAPVGRDEQRRALREHVRAGHLVTLTGPAGIGKTRLALAVAEDVAVSFADHVWVTDLTSTTEPDQVAGQLAATIGVELRPGLAPIDALRGFTSSIGSDAGVLLVLDNCEHLGAAVTEVVEELLGEPPDASPVAVLATSREPLDVPGEMTWTVAPLSTPAGPAPGELAASSAVTLFLARLSPPRTVAELSTAEREALAEICRCSDGLPLALKLAAARSRVYSLPEVAATLRNSPMALENPGRGTGRHTSLRAVIEDNHSLATRDERIAHRRLSMLPTTFTTDAALAVCGLTPIHRDRVVDLLVGLVRRSLLAAAPPTSPGGTTSFHQLVVLHAHAQQALEVAGEGPVVRAARDRWLFDAIVNGAWGGRPGQARWYDWLDENTPTIRLVLTEALAGTSASALDEALLAVARLTAYWWDRRRSAEALHWLPRAARAAGDSFAGHCVRTAHATYLALGQDIEKARDQLAMAPAKLAACRPHQRADAAEVLVDAAAGAWVGDDYGLAASLAVTALGLGEELGDPHIVLRARAIHAATELLRGRPAHARRAAEAVGRDNQEVGNDFAALFVALIHALTALFESDAEAGLHWSTEILRSQRRLGVRDHADTLEQRAGHYLNAGRPLAAARCYGAARAMHQQLGRSWPRHEGTAKRLTDLKDRLGRAAYREALTAGERLADHSEPETWLS